MNASRPPVCDYEDSDYQDRFWGRGERAYEDRAEAVALRRLLPRGGQRLLEIGAGAGRNTPRYTGFGQIVLLDYSRSQLEQAQARLGRGDPYLYVAADVYRLPFAPGAFDTATMIRVLHHMADPLAALGQVRQVMRPAGIFVLEYANKHHLKAVARWLLHRQAWSPFTLEPVEFAALNFDFHPRAVRGWLETAGFRLARQLTVSHFRLGLLKRRVPVGLLVWLDSLAQWTGGWWQLSPSVFVRAQAAGAAGGEAAGTFWRCPACLGLELRAVKRGLRCTGCGRLWPLLDGIFDFRTPPHRA